MLTAVSSTITRLATTCAELISSCCTAGERWTCRVAGRQLAQGDGRQHVCLAAARHERPEILGKGDGHRGVGPGLNDEELRPAEEERPKLPNASRRKTYCPPAPGSMAASSAQQLAPRTVNSPPNTHRPISSAGEGTSRAMMGSARKIAEPIIEPTTSVVASNNRSRFSGCSGRCITISIAEGCQVCYRGRSPHAGYLRRKYTCVKLKR